MYTIIYQTGVVTRDIDGLVVSPVNDSSDEGFILYQSWVTAGNTPLEGVYNEPNQVPYSVTPRQIRLALTIVGLRSIVESAVENGSQEVKDTWNFSTEILRSNPLINAMASAIGQSTEQVDKLFQLAESL